MSQIALQTGADSLRAQIMSLADEGNPEKSFLIAHYLGKIADELKKTFQTQAVDFWLQNKELPGGYTCKETSRSLYSFEEDAEWQRLSAQLKAREEVLKKATEAPVAFYDGSGEFVPKVTKKQSAIYSFSIK